MAQAINNDVDRKPTVSVTVRNPHTGEDTRYRGILTVETEYNCPRPGLNTIHMTGVEKGDLITGEGIHVRDMKIETGDN